MMATLLEEGMLLLKHQDLHRKSIVSMRKVDETHFVVEYKDRSMEFIAAAVIAPPGPYSIVCANTKENVQSLLNQWDAYTKNQQTVIVFFDTKSGKRWSIKPYLHNKVSEPKTLVTGIWSLFSNC